ncbi:MAG: methylated-DNA--[protein]-cysteine S-methyltransferase, partial [Planctomycetota bacterium]|nr:methylated-DNA--[protein]-cysteine S-methyltransferase [Planctomycetota bacterium]
LSLVPTALGCIGQPGAGESVHGAAIGHRSAAARRQRGGTRSSRESDWDPELRSRMEDFAAGEPTDFDDVSLVLPPMTRFRFRVMTHVRGIAYGQTNSYGEVAERVGHPRAARAVGSVMANNPVPILVPCHRIIAASGQLGGFSSPQGPRLKKRLLELESGVTE